MPEEDEDHEADDGQLFDQGMLQVVDRALDQVGAVVGDDELDSFGERSLALLELGLHSPDDVHHVLAVAHDDDSARHLPLAVELGDAPAHFGAQLDPGDVFDPNRRPFAVGPDSQVADVVQRPNVPAPPHGVFLAGELYDPAAHFVVALADDLDDFVDGQIEGEQLDRIEDHLVLLDVSADRRDFGDARNARNPIADVPVVE